MINVNEVKQYIEFLARKAQSGGTFTPNEYNLVLPRVVNDIVRKYYGVPEQYQPMRPEPAISAEITQLVRDYLSALKPVVTLKVTNGIATLPTDYIHKISGRVREFINVPAEVITHQCEDVHCDCGNDVSTPTVQKTTPKAQTKYYPLVFMSDEQFNWAMNSVKRYPTTQFPIARMQSGAIEISPASITELEFSYIRYPKKPFWNSTSVNGQSTYTPNGSQDIELPDICGTEVVLAMLDKLGISIREQQIVNWADRARQKGA